MKANYFHLDSILFSFAVGSKFIYTKWSRQFLTLSMAYLVLIRHGESEDNAQDIVSGNRNPNLTEKGRAQACQAAEGLRGISFQGAYVSQLIRTQQTLDELMGALGVTIPTITAGELNERDWGTVQGRFMEEINRTIPKSEQSTWSNWETPIPGGESFAQLSKRVVGYLTREILPRVRQGENILVAGHNGVLRTIRRYLEKVPYENIESLRLNNSEVYVYTLNAEGEVTEVRNVASESTPLKPD